MNTDFLVIGSGISGLNFALNAAKKGKVVLLTKKKIIDSNTNYAQGGIAAVLADTDNPKKHIADTLEAGAHHNNKKAVKYMVENSTAAIYRLVELGVEFEQENGTIKLGQEGGHGQRRIAHVGDYTGKEIESILTKRVKNHPNITVHENAFVKDLIVKKGNCIGCEYISNNKIDLVFAGQTILATGGAGQLFSYTTNPAIATGDGLAMAIRAGAKIQDIEFIQFHPTAFTKKLKHMFLISEAVRGEGAKLLNSKRKRFMSKIHPQKELAPRDIVARAIYEELKNGPVYLDITKKSAKELKSRFPKIYSTLEKHKIKMEKHVVPITPAAHYMCGGIKTDIKGQTSIKNLFAFGEVACTGVHGANRLASNSLLEALVFSNTISDNLQKIPQKITEENHKEKKAKIDKNEDKQAKKLRVEVQDLMWQYAGIVRSLKTVKKEAIPKLKELESRANQLTAESKEVHEAKNLIQISKFILKAITKRRCSLGCHFVK